MVENHGRAAPSLRRRGRSAGLVWSDPGRHLRLAASGSNAVRWAARAEKSPRSAKEWQQLRSAQARGRTGERAALAARLRPSLSFVGAAQRCFSSERAFVRSLRSQAGQKGARCGQVPSSLVGLTLISGASWSERRFCLRSSCCRPCSCRQDPHLQRACHRGRACSSCRHQWSAWLRLCAWARGDVRL